MILRRVIACLAVAAPAVATDELITAANVEPSSAAQHQIRVELRTNEAPACPNVSVYVSVPRESGGVAATGVDVRIADRTGQPIYSGVLGLVTVDYSDSPISASSTHPFYQRGGFHGARLCIQESLLDSTQLTVDFGPQPNGVSHVLNLGPLSKWRLK